MGAGAGPGVGRSEGASSQHATAKESEVHVAKPITRTLSGFCTLDGATLNVKFEASELRVKLQQELEKRLGKKQAGVQWTEKAEGADFRIRFVEVEQGNQFLRYLLPFIAPAVIEVEGDVTQVGQPPAPFHYVQKAQVGLFGGSARSMLGNCASQLANKIAKEIQRGVLGN